MEKSRKIGGSFCRLLGAVYASAEEPTVILEAASSLEISVFGILHIRVFLNQVQQTVHVQPHRKAVVEVGDVPPALIVGKDTGRKVWILLRINAVEQGADLLSKAGLVGLIAQVDVEGDLVGGGQLLSCALMLCLSGVTLLISHSTSRASTFMLAGICWYSSLRISPLTCCSTFQLAGPNSMYSG